MAIIRKMIDGTTTAKERESTRETSNNDQRFEYNKLFETIAWTRRLMLMWN